MVVAVSPFLVIVLTVAFIYGAGRWLLWWLETHPGACGGGREAYGDHVPGDL